MRLCHQHQSQQRLIHPGIPLCVGGAYVHDPAVQQTHGLKNHGTLAGCQFGMFSKISLELQKPQIRFQLRRESRESMFHAGYVTRKQLIVLGLHGCPIPVKKKWRMPLPT